MRFSGPSKRNFTISRDERDFRVAVFRAKRDFTVFRAKRNFRVAIFRANWRTLGLRF